MDVFKTFYPYNARRYSKPWGANITLEENGWHYNFTGVWLGDASDGGDVVIKNVTPNSIVAFGRRDNRNSKHTENDWFTVQDDGSLVKVGKREARKIIEGKNSEE